jgi:hypothetical protein
MPYVTNRAIILRQVAVLADMEQVDQDFERLPDAPMGDSESDSSSESESDDSSDSDDNIDSSDSSEDDDSSDSESEDGLDAPPRLQPANADIRGLEQRLSQIRYFQERFNSCEAYMLRTHTVEQWFHQAWFNSPRLFRIHFRMDCENFERLLSLIQDHPVFQTRSSMAKQVLS